MARVALVTGGARGIGLAVVRRLLHDGFEVVVASRSTVTPDAECVICDVSDRHSVDRLVGHIERTRGRLDVLVNNAGVGSRTPLLSLSVPEWERLHAVNLTAAFHCTQAVAPIMARGGWGRIVNVASLAARAGGRLSSPAYAAAKAGLLGLTRAAALALGPLGITVNAVCPGIIATDMTSDLGEDLRTGLRAQIPLGRLGEPEDVAGVVAFLCGEDSRYVTGATIDVNGGMYMA